MKSSPEKQMKLHQNPGRRSLAPQNTVITATIYSAKELLLKCAEIIIQSQDKFSFLLTNLID